MFSKRKIVLTVFLLLGAGAVTHIWLQLDAGSSITRATRMDPRSTARRSISRCEPWCANHEAAWSAKCGWHVLSCAACAACTHHGRDWIQPVAEVTGEAVTEAVDEPTALAAAELKKAKQQVLSHVDQNAMIEWLSEWAGGERYR